MNLHLPALATLTALAVAPLLIVAAPASAEPAEGTYAEHVVGCARAGHLDGDHNPGMHHGHSGWTGTCHE